MRDANDNVAIFVVFDRDGTELAGRKAMDISTSESMEV